MILISVQFSKPLLGYWGYVLSMYLSGVSQTWVLLSVLVQFSRHLSYCFNFVPWRLSSEWGWALCQFMCRIALSVFFLSMIPPILWPAKVGGEPCLGSSDQNDRVSFGGSAARAAALLLCCSLWNSVMGSCSKTKLPGYNKIKWNLETWEMHPLLGHFSKFWLSFTIYHFCSLFRVFR